MAFGKIIPKEVFQLAKLAALNVHPSLLPKYRGAAPIERALIAGELSTGVSIINIGERLDAGDIFAQRKYDITDQDEVFSLYQKLFNLGGQMLIEVMSSFHHYKNNKVIQDGNKASYAHKITTKDLNINWQFEAVKIHRQVIALAKHGYAQTKFNQYMIKIIGVEPAADKQITKHPGELVFDKKNLYISCGNHTALKVIRLQLAGKNIIDSTSFINGYLKQKKLLPCFI